MPENGDRAEDEPCSRITAINQATQFPGTGKKKVRIVSVKPIKEEEKEGAVEKAVGMELAVAKAVVAVGKVVAANRFDRSDFCSPFA